MVIEWNIDLTDLTETEAVMNDVVIVPDNALITKVEAESLETAATGVAVDVGLLHISRDTSDAAFTADPNGILAAYPTASMAIGERTTLVRGADGLASVHPDDDQAFAGALIGTVTAAPCVLTASATTSTAFTAGQLLVRVYFRPNALSGF
jgi:hypothetical protein